jgi:hypothetical protein
MDYQKASQTRKKSLLSLIAEKKFEEGQGIGASIGGAISDKFKAKATGFKEAIDPLNWVRKLTGKGTFGDIATTIAGRAFGRSDKSISYFGGYKRKNKKDPNFTTVSAGPIKPLRTGDSSADIVAKMYNFMLKTHEINKINDEIEKSFRQEQMDEDDRRHEELVEAIKKSKSKTAKLDPKKEESGGFMDFIKNLLAGEALMALAAALVPALIAAGLAATIGAILLPLLFRDKNPEATNKGIQNAGKSDGGMAEAIVEVAENTDAIERRKQNILGNRPSAKKSYLNPKKDVELQKKYLEEIGFDEKTGLTEDEKKQGFVRLDTEGIPVKEPLTKKEAVEQSAPVPNQQTTETKPTNTGDSTKPTASTEKSRETNSTPTAAASPTVVKSSADAASPTVVKSSAVTSTPTLSAVPTSAPTAVPAPKEPEKTSIPITNTTVKSASSPNVTPIPNSASAKNVPAPQPIPKSSTPNIPEQIDPSKSLSSGEQIISQTNNKINNIGGKPPKTIQTASSRQRNTDINKQLANISVPV